MSSQLERSEIGVRYLLGELSAEEEQSFEQEYFANDELFEDLQITEVEVIDAYVANELDDRLRKHFEQRVAMSPRLRQRVAFSRALAERASSRPIVTAPASDVGDRTWWRKLIPAPFFAERVPAWALAASLIGILGIAAVVVQSVRLRNESQRLAAERAELAQQRTELARLSAEQSERTSAELREAQARHQRAEELLKTLEQPPEDKSGAAPAFAAITLLPGSLRSGDERRRELPLHRDTPEVRLRLALDSVDYRTYRVTINSGDKEIQRNGIRPMRSNTLALRLPASSFAPGIYTVKVEGVTPTGHLEPVSNYTFRVSHKQ